MFISRPLPTGHPVINAELLERADRFQTALHERLKALSPFTKVMIVIGLGLATCMEIGTATAVNVILPDMQGNVGATSDQISWTITIYSTAFLCSLPLSPWLARRFGHRDHILLSIALHALGAVGCFLSHELWMLLLSRVVMGIGGGGLLVRSLVTIYQLVSGKSRAKYFLLFATVLQSFRALMPVIFGLVTDWITWNTAFLIVIPIGMASATLIYVFIPRGIDFEAEPPRPDFAGIGFLVAGVTAFQITASRGEQDDWFGSFHIRAAFVIGVFALTAFTLRDIDLKNPHPFLNLRLIVTQRPLFAGLGIALVFGAMLSGGLYVLPQYLRTIQTYNATQTGLFYFVDGLASLVGYYLMMKLSPHFGLFFSNFAALILFIIGNCGFLHMLTGDTPAATICIFLVLHGVSTGMLIPGIGMLILPAIDLRFISFGAAIYLFFRSLGASIGVSAVLVLLDIRQTLHSSRLLDTANQLNPRLAQTLGAITGVVHSRGIGINNSSLGAYQLLSGMVNTQARLLSFIDVFWALQILGLAGILLLLFSRAESTGVSNVSAVDHTSVAINI
jgi:DHA2 family multidrug resistance protein